MNKWFVLLSFFFSTTVPGQTYWQQQVDFRINVKLNPADNSLQAVEQIYYTNHSPDTLTFIWFHLWTNAYGNKRSAFNQQLLQQDDMRFHFAKPAELGYIDGLEFMVEDKKASSQVHPEHADIIKLILPDPLLPGKRISITTPFYVKLPYNFSRGGWHEKTYQVTQWYPKPAVYDKDGWHLFPYLDQGEFYSEFGNYEVSIQVPKPFTVAATGIPQQKLDDALYFPYPDKVQKLVKKLPERDWSKTPFKTITYKQEHIHDFAWFADTTFTLQRDTLTLPSGKLIHLQTYFNLAKLDIWQNSLNNLKDAIRYLSARIGDYPYSTVTLVDGEQGFTGGMEYPTITILTGIKDPKILDLTIFHEIGHNWFYGALATNERTSPWMDEGMNTYYQNSYEAWKYPTILQPKKLFDLMNDPRVRNLKLYNASAQNKDQPISTPSERFTKTNYNLIAYEKTAQWMQLLEKTLGSTNFDQAMQQYYAKWAYKHPDREDFKKIIEQTSGKQLDSIFQLLDKKGPLLPLSKRPLALVPLFQPSKAIDRQPMWFLPIASYNTFNGFEPGFVMFNYTLPIPNFQWSAITFFGTKSGALNGWGQITKQWHPEKIFNLVELSAVTSRFNTRNFPASAAAGPYNFRFLRFSPSLKMALLEKNPLSRKKYWLQWQWHFITEDKLDLLPDNKIKLRESLIRHFFVTRFVAEHNQKPFSRKHELLLEGHRDFLRLGLTGEYFMHYNNRKGIGLRLFAGKFIHRKNSMVNIQSLQRFYLQMTGSSGTEDFLYTTPFIGRFETEGISARQIMPRDGYFKIRADKSTQEIGTSNNWLTAANLTIDLPIPLPVKVFVDLGTTGDLLNKNTSMPALLYDAGIQIPLMKNIMQVYIPLLYSRVYADYFRTIPSEKGLFQRISFTMQYKNLNLSSFFNSGK